MQVKATHRYLRMSPQKVRLVLPAVRGTRAVEAIQLLRLAPQAAAAPVSKVIKSAVANAAHNYSLDPTTLVIDSATADQGPGLRRFVPRARGRADAMRRPTCHVTIVLRDVPQPKGSAADRMKRVAKKAVPKRKSDASTKTDEEAKAAPAKDDQRSVKDEATKEAESRPAVDNKQVTAGKAAAKEAAPRRTAQQTGRGSVTRSAGKGQQKKGQS